MDQSDKDKERDEQLDKGFAVHDKRRIGKEDAPEQGYTAPNGPAQQAAGPGVQPAPESAGTTQGTKPSESTGRPAEGAAAGPEAFSRAGERDYVPLTFASFIMSLSTSALIYLGQVPDPVTGKTGTDLVGARQTIDLISLLREKTAGNLTPDEAGLIEAVLYDLRMLFVNANP